jgi:hypothetical protein
MGKYTRYQLKSPVKKVMHPIWRGIGCILIIVIPLMAYGLMLITAPAIIKTGLVPYQLLGYLHFPVWVFRFHITSAIAVFIGSLKNLWFNIIVFFVMLLILAGITSSLYSALYQLVGPARYTSLDAPPSKHKAKRYTR